MWFEDRRLRRLARRDMSWHEPDDGAGDGPYDDGWDEAEDGAAGR